MDNNFTDQNFTQQFSSVKFSLIEPTAEIGELLPMAKVYPIYRAYLIAKYKHEVHVQEIIYHNFLGDNKLCYAYVNLISTD